jgi:hypothetical protein
MLRIAHCLDSRLSDGGEVVSVTHRPRSTPQKYFLLVIPVTGRVDLKATVWLEGLGILKVQ